MKNIFIGFVLGLATVATLTFAVDYSDIDWYGSHIDYGFKKAVERCEVDGSEITC